MVREIDKYIYRVMWSEEDGESIGLCAEFPSLSVCDNRKMTRCLSYTVTPAICR